MDQTKIGTFLKKMRKEKGLTQEQLAEQLNVSARTVSRWETGSNMPDISLLVEIAEFYNVSIPELIDGERKSEKMNEEVKEVASKMSDYAGNEKTAILKDIFYESLIGVCALAVWMILELIGAGDAVPLAGSAALFCQTLVSVTVVMIFLHASGLLYRFGSRRRESTLPKPVLAIAGMAAAFAVAFVLKMILTGLGL